MGSRWPRVTRMTGLPGREKHSAVWIQYTSVVWQTDRRTDTGRQLVLRLRVASRGKNTLHQWLYIKFADRTKGVAAGDIIPRVRKSAPQMHAWLCLRDKIRFSWLTVGIRHLRHCFTVGVCWLHSPNERRVATWINALSRRPVHVSPWVANVTATDAWTWNTQRPAVINHSRTVPVVRECCKGDDPSQSETGNSTRRHAKTP